MTAVPCLFDVRVVAGSFLLCLTLALSACSGSVERPVSRDTPPPDATLYYTAAMGFEDRQMMKHYLVKSLHDGVTAVAVMQVQIDCRHDITSRSE